jgi:hypothetical protein
MTSWKFSSPLADSRNRPAFYSSTIFVEAGYSVRQALLASFGFGLVNT